jgi:Tol biopolymer transport system component
LVAGALRGGTHAHTWSADGKWISFTYNDYLIETLEKSTKGAVKDLRTIGVMTSAKKVKVLVENDENFSGEYFAVVAATVNEKPTPGSDEVERAFDECWIGKEGYTKVDGTKQNYAIAFQGNIRTANGAQVAEVFVADIPEDITQSDKDKPLEGTTTTRANVPKGLIQRRITFTTDRKHPGIQGPRFRLRSSPDGSEVYFLMKDDNGIIQIFSVPTQGGSIRQITNLDHSVQSQFNVSPDGKLLSVVADNSIWFVGTANGETVRVTKRMDDEDRPVGGALWSHNGKILVFNRYVSADNKPYLQIVKINVN